MGHAQEIIFLHANQNITALVHLIILENQMPGRPIKLPAGFAPAFAMGVADVDGNLSLIGSGKPLPVRPATPPPPPALSGSTSATTLAGPFAPVADLPVVVELSGEWTGTVGVSRSTDGGTSLHPLTAGGQRLWDFSANACEPVWIESQPGAELYLDIRLATGTLAYRVSQ